MILVMLGTQNNDFHRLLEEIEKNIENGNINEEVVVQAGFTKYKSDKMKIFSLTSKEKFEDLIKKANLVITHAGVGTILNCIKLDKPVIATPRLVKYQEHQSDHQIEIIQYLLPPPPTPPLYQTLRKRNT